MKQAHRIILAFAFCLVVLMPRTCPALFESEDGGYASPQLMNDAVLTFSDWTSHVNNPALLTEVDQKEITLGGLLLLEDAGYNFVSVALPFRLRQTAAVSFYFAGLGGVEEIGANAERLGTTFDVGEWDAVLSYAYRVLPALSVGTNMNIMGRNVLSSEFGAGFDLGFVWNPVNHYRFGNLNLGLDLQNVFHKSMRDSGTATRYPKNARVAVSYGLWRNRLVLDAEGMMIDLEGLKSEFGLDSTGLQIPVVRPIKVGLHGRYFLMRGLAAKAGYNNNNLPFVGILLLAKRVSIFRQLRLDYDFWLDKNGVGVSNMLKVAARVGKTREELESRRLYRKLIIAPMNDFNEAMRLYLAGMYWEASFAFGKVIALYPGFHKNDMAALYMGKCYEYLSMNQAARAIYSDALKKYTTSDMRPRYIYQLQNVDYKEAKYEDALKNYGFIMNLYGSSSIKSSADYVAGQIYYQQGNFSQARDVLSQIPAGDENYGYAQYTLAMIFLQEKNKAGAIEHLNNVIALQSQANSDRVLTEAASTKLGHIFLEDVKLVDALNYYKKVAPTSRYGDEALLGAAWCCIKANKREMFMLAAQYCDQLIGNQPKSPLVPEAYLAKGYCYTMLAEYGAAKENFQKCIDLLRQPILTEEQISRKQQEFQSVSREFGPTENEIMLNALRKPDDRVLSARPGMRDQFSQYQQTQKDKLLFLDRLDQVRTLRSSREKILRDAEFALATAENLTRTMKKEQVLRDYERNQQKINTEMEQLQKELKALDK